MNREKIKVVPLGQTGFCFEFGDVCVLIDPYLSDFSQKQEGDELRRLIPIPIKPDEFEKINWLLVTHEHLDHCDPDTILPLVNKFPELKIFGPHPVCEILKNIGVHKDQIFLATSDWKILNTELKMQPKKIY